MVDLRSDCSQQSFIEGMLIATFDIIGNIEEMETEEEFRRIMGVIHHEMDFVDFLRGIRDEHSEGTSREWATIAYHEIYTSPSPETKQFQKYFQRNIEEEYQCEIVKNEEQKILEELAEFVLRFNEKYHVLLNVKIKPMKNRKGLK